jgi:RNA polymerase sigma-70 factor, ECF subfamily
MNCTLAEAGADVFRFSRGGRRGRAPSVGLPIHGADRISRFFVGIRRLQPADLQLWVMPMNGGIGVLAIAGGNIIQAMSFEIADNRVRAIYIVRNPDKLRHLREVAL